MKIGPDADRGKVKKLEKEIAKPEERKSNPDALIAPNATKPVAPCPPHRIEEHHNRIAAAKSNQRIQVRQVSPHVSKQCLGRARPPGAPNTNGRPRAIGGSLPVLKSSTESIPSAEQTASKLTNHVQPGFLQALLPNSGYHSCCNCCLPKQSSHAAAR